MLDCVCLISRNDRRVITISITISLWYVAFYLRRYRVCICSVALLWSFCDSCIRVRPY